MLRVFSFSRRPLIPLVASLLLTGLLAGCVGGEDAVKTSDAEDVPPGCEGAIMGTIAEGGAISMENTTVQQPFTVCITNEDTQARSFMAMPNKPPKPEFVPLPAVLDPHAAHRGGADPVIAPLTVQVGQTVIISDVPFHGTVMFMEVENLDNSLVWEILPEAAATYPVVENQIILSGGSSGDTDAGATSIYTFDVAVPDLAKIQLTLVWDDAEDDASGGQAANQADTLEVRLIDPTGTEVAKKSLEKRAGEIKIEHALEIPAFPTEITDEGMMNATARLSAERPPDESAFGTWTVEVAVLSAPGAIPDEDGSTKELPIGDGHQSWNLGVKTVHRWASIGFVGVENGPDIVQANLSS